MLHKFTTLSATVVLSVMLIFSSVYADDLITIKFSHVTAVNTPKGQMANKFRDLIAERLSGKVIVEVFPNSQLFGDNKVLEAILLGDVEMAAPSLSKFGRYTKKLQLFDLPFLFKDMETVEKFQKSPDGQKLLDSLSNKGLKGLGYLHNGLKQLSSSTPLQVPADAKGLKFRIQSSNVLAAQFLALKATPLKKPFSEVFTLLQTRAIDGQENTWSNIYSKKFFEVQPYISETNHGLIDYLVVTSNEFWSGLSDDIRAEVKKALDEAIVFGNEVARGKIINDRQKIIDSKRCQILQISSQERALWVEAMKPVWKQFEDEIGKDIIDSAYGFNM